MVAFLIGASALACGTSPPFREEFERFRSVEPGMAEEEVRRRLGEPAHEYDRATAPSPYYVDGYAYEEHPITGRVLIYIGTEPIAYVYLDLRNEVEHVFVGGS